MSKYLFYTDCTNSDAVGPYGECINEMVQSPHCEDIDSHDFLFDIAQQYHFQDGLAQMFGHASLEEMANDFALSCHRSLFQGHPCFYVRFSGIEHIFVDERSLRQLVTGDELQARIAAIEGLDEALDDDDPWDQAATPDELAQALTNFVERHYPTFVQHNILLASLFAYHNPYQDLVRTLDQNLLMQPAIVNQELNIYVYSQYPLLSSDESARQFSEQIRRVIETATFDRHPNDAPMVFSPQPPVDANTFNATISYEGPWRNGFADFVTDAIHKGAKGLTCTAYEQWSLLKNTPSTPATPTDAPAPVDRNRGATLRR
jgi:hypothetical protein